MPITETPGSMCKNPKWCPMKPERGHQEIAGQLFEIRTLLSGNNII